MKILLLITMIYQGSLDFKIIEYGFYDNCVIAGEAIVEGIRAQKVRIYASYSCVRVPQ